MVELFPPLGSAEGASHGFANRCLLRNIFSFPEELVAIETLLGEGFPVLEVKDTFKLRDLLILFIWKKENSAANVTSSKKTWHMEEQTVFS